VDDFLVPKDELTVQYWDNKLVQVFGQEAERSKPFVEFFKEFIWFRIFNCYLF
jgi:hypothetical protein